MPCFLPAGEMKPRTLCASQSVAFWISARVAPLGRAIMSRIFAPLLSTRGAAAFLAVLRAGLPAFLLAFAPAWAAFFGAAFALPPLAVFLALGAPSFWLAAFFAGAFSGATCALCAATAAALSVALVSAVVMCVRILFCA